MMNIHKTQHIILNWKEKYTWMSIIKTATNIRRKLNKKQTAHRKEQHDVFQQQREISLAKVSILSVGLFLLAWMPYALVALIGHFWGPRHLNPYASTIPALFAKSQCIYNTFVYGCGHSSYRYGHYSQPWEYSEKYFVSNNAVAYKSFKSKKTRRSINILKRAEYISHSRNATSYK